MKRLKTVLCAVLVAVLGLICLTACGKTGTYKFSYMKMTQGATSIEIRAGESYMGLTLSEEAFVMELREDGTASMSMDMFGETLSEEGTWTENAEDKRKVDTLLAEEIMIRKNLFAKKNCCELDGRRLPPVNFAAGLFCICAKYLTKRGGCAMLFRNKTTKGHSHVFQNS